MKANKKQWVFGLGMAALMAVSSLSIPAMTERMIASAEDNVQVEEAQEENERRSTTVSDAGEIVGYEVSDEAEAALTQHGRKAFQEVFGIEIPEEYKAIDTMVYEDEGDMRYTLSLMPAGWEESVDPMPALDARSFYMVLFGSVNVETGEATLLGLQRYVLGYMDVDTYQEAEYTSEQIEAMEEKARAFAAELGMDAQALIGTDKVAGSYLPGCMLTFSLGEGKTLSVAVSAEGEISGYSLIPGKG